MAHMSICGATAACRGIRLSLYYRQVDVLLLDVRHSRGPGRAGGRTANNHPAVARAAIVPAGIVDNVPRPLVEAVQADRQAVARQGLGRGREAAGAPEPCGVPAGGQPWLDAVQRRDGLHLGRLVGTDAVDPARAGLRLLRLEGIG